MQSRWTYEPFDDVADDFNSRVGRVLNRGAYSGAMHKSNTYASSTTLGAPEVVGSKASTHNPQLPCLDSSTATRSIALAGTPEYTWVDAEGNQLTGAATNKSPGTTPSELKCHGNSLTKPYNKEVMDLWKRVNPGVMQDYVDMPDSTMTDHFRWLPDQQDPLNMTCHFKKTDFSEYNEVAARSMKGLITNKSSA